MSVSSSLLENLAVAIEREDAKQVSSLLRSGSIDVNARLPRALNPPPLVLAAEKSPAHGESPRIVELLLNAGARIDDADYNGETACHVAASLGRLRVLHLLLSRSPNLALRDNHGQTALQLAICFNSISEPLIAAGAPLDGISQADLCRLAGNSDSDTVLEMLISRGVVISELRGESGRTPLHFAMMSMSSLSPLVLHNKLIACGVDLDAFTTDSNRHTCASLAVRYRRADALSIFLRAGANVNQQQLLQLSVIEDSYDCLLLLLAAGADVTARDGDGKTACIVAAEYAHTRTRKDVYVLRFMHALLAGGSDLDAADNHGTTARQLLASRQLSIDDEQVESARRNIAKARLDFVRHRALQVCIGLQSLRLDALQMCEILVHACGPLAPLIAFHQWWKIATTVKHFH